MVEVVRNLLVKAAYGLVGGTVAASTVQCPDTTPEVALQVLVMAGATALAAQVKRWLERWLNPRR